MAVDTAPDREEFIAEEPTPDANLDAPYGYKKDGTPAKRRGRQPGTKLGPRSTSGKSLESQIGGLLLMVNMPLQLIPALQKDALDTIEITALAKAINEECTRNARFRKYVESALKIQGATSIVSVLSLIIGRRIIRHEILTIPDEMGGAAGVDASLGSLISVISGQGAINTNLMAMQQET